VFRRLSVSLAAIAVLAGCAGNSGTTSTTTTSTTPVTTTTTVAAPPPTQEPRVEKWVDLQVGECLADPPPSDPSVVTVAVVDCGSAHAAEVYLRAAVEVNAALDDVANQQCGTGLAQYTGQPVSPYTTTYLIDSEQDRTSNNPMPSTVICLLQDANGGPLTGSARH
jgi:ABC-type glycerol-3-phosphate transport system substrate-binding protein